MNITKEQEEMNSIVNPELYAKIKGKKIKYTKEIEYSEVKKPNKKGDKNNDNKEIYGILEILFKVLGYSFLLTDLTFAFLFLIVGDVFRVINRNSESRKGGGVVGQ
jgi:hypothetical protein